MGGLLLTFQFFAQRLIRLHLLHFEQLQGCCLNWLVISELPLEDDLLRKLCLSLDYLLSTRLQQKLLLRVRGGISIGHDGWLCVLIGNVLKFGWICGANGQWSLRVIWNVAPSPLLHFKRHLRRWPPIILILNMLTTLIVATCNRWFCLLAWRRWVGWPNLKIRAVLW